MDLEITDSSEDKIQFVLRNETAFVANWLRRIIKSEVPTLSIDKVMIIHNTSPLQDELVVHRLGLIPIVSEVVDQMDYPDECDCEDELCKRCSVVFSLDVKCEESSRWVTSSDFKTNNKHVYPVVFSDGQYVKITRLKKGQRLTLKALVKKGNGGTHAKWTPVIAPTMNYEDEDVNSEGEYKEIKMGFTSVGQLSATEILATGLNILKRNMFHLSYTASQK